MKTTENDLDVAAKKKLDSLDGIVSYGKDASVLYRNGAFVPGPLIDSLFSRKIYSDDNVLDLKRHLFRSEDNFISAFDTPMTDRAYDIAPGLSVNVKATAVFHVDSSMLLCDRDSEFFYVFTDDGTAHRISRIDPTDRLTLGVTAAISKEFVSDGEPAHDITAISGSADSVMIATGLHGMFVMSWDGKQIGRFAPENGITGIDRLSDGHILVTRKDVGPDSVVIIDSDTGERVISFPQLFHSYQAVYDVCSRPGFFAVLGRQYSPLPSDRMVHFYSSGKTGISYHCIDDGVPLTSMTDGFLPKLIRCDSGSVFVLGTDGGHLMLRVFSGTDLTDDCQDYLFTDFDADFGSVKDFSISGDTLRIVAAGKLLCAKLPSLNISGVYNLTDMPRSADSFIDGDGVFFWRYNEMAECRIDPPEKAQQISINVDNSSLCNNIDVMVKIDKGSIALFNPDKAMTFKPDIHMQYGDFHVLKIIGCSLKSFVIRIDGMNDLGGVVVHTNRIFTGD